MNGTVEFFNVTKGVGVVRGEDGKNYFAHYSKIVGNGLKFLLAGERVGFTKIQHDQQKGPQATKISVLAPRTDVKKNPREIVLADNQTTLLRLNGLGLIHSINGKLVKPSTEVAGRFKAYYVGTHRIQGFDVLMPSSNEDAAFVLLDPEKNPRAWMPYDMKYTKVHNGSYVLTVDTDGKVRVQCFGRRHQEDKKGEHRNWIIVERRFAHRYDVTDASEDSLRSQTPTSGFERDNDGFVKGILRGLEIIEAARTSKNAKTAASS